MGRKYLLDTHVLIWALTEPERLPLAVRQTIEDRRHLFRSYAVGRVFLSVPS
jgi:PIN domain nuclease of toxin-antitoxin system